MKFEVSDKPQALIEKISAHYYVIHMGQREIGGTNRSALENYARKHGFKVVAGAGAAVSFGLSINK